MAALREQVGEWKERYYVTLGRQLYDGVTTIGESDLDYKRGYFKAMDRLLNQPRMDYEQVQRDLQRSEVSET